MGLAISLALVGTAANGVQAMKVGFGKACITPPLGTPCARGLSGGIVEVFDDLYTHAVSIRIGDQKALIISSDVIGLYPGDVREFTARISRATSVPPERIVLHATQTHETANSRWDVSRLLAPYGLADEHSGPAFRVQFADGLLKAAQEAVNTASDCEMAYAESEVHQIASNRRITVDGKVELRGSRCNPADRALPEGVIDPLLRVVLFRAKDSGRLIGICSYNCHPSAAGGDVAHYATADFPGVGIGIAEREIGSVQLLHLTGCCGEINPGKYTTGDTKDPRDRKKDVQALGRRYADAIEAAIKSANGWQTPGSLAMKYESIALTVKKDLPDEAECRRQLDKAVEGYRAKKAAGAAPPIINRFLYQYYNRLRTRDGKQQTYASALRIGDVYFTFMPGEIFQQFGAELRKSFGNPKLVNSCDCYDLSPSYVPPPKAFEEGGYESNVALVAPQAYAELMTQMQSLLADVKPRE